MCKYINAKVDDPSAVVSFVKNLQFTGVILYRGSVNWIHIGLLKQFWYGRLSRHDF